MHYPRFIGGSSLPHLNISEPKDLRRSFYEKLVNGFQLLTIFAKGTIFDFRLGSEYASDLLCQNQQ